MPVRWLRKKERGQGTNAGKDVQESLVGGQTVTDTTTKTGVVAHPEMSATLPPDMPPLGLHFQDSVHLQRHLLIRVLQYSGNRKQPTIAVR